MLEPMNFDKLVEADITRMIELIGGKRASLDASKETEGNADYVLGNAVIELKFLDSDRLESLTDKSKLADIFSWDDAPVVVLDPMRLDETGQRKFHEIQRQTIENQIKKAARQFKVVREREPETEINVCMIVNNGFWSISHDTLQDLAINRATHSTKSLDYIIVSGIYYHGDGFEKFFFAPIDIVRIRPEARVFDRGESLRQGWNKEVAERHATKIIMEVPVAENWAPVSDVSFEHGDKVYIKPAPAIGGQSEFYRGNRPRHNNTGLNKVPMVALPFPDFSEAYWCDLKGLIHDGFRLQDSFTQWRNYVNDIARRDGSELKPFVRVSVSAEDWPQDRGPRSFHDLCQMAADKMNREAMNLRDNAIDHDDARIVINNYVCACTTVIGQDMANDYSHILFVRNATLGDLKLETVLVAKTRIFHEYAVSLGAVYAYIHRVPLRFSRDLTYAWH